MLLGRKYTVFVYGSLMEGFYGYKTFMKDAKFISKARVKGDLRFFCSDYPVMIKKLKGSKYVQGELYEVDQETMGNLRKYEGIGNPFTCYTEKVVQAETEDETLTARAFVVIPTIEMPMLFTSRHIPEGDWRKFKKAKKRLPVSQPLVMFLLVFLLGELVWYLGF